MKTQLKKSAMQKKQTKGGTMRLKRKRQILGRSSMTT